MLQRHGGHEVTWELDRLACAIDRLRRLNANLRRPADREERRILSEQQRLCRLGVMAAFQSVRIAAEAGDEDAQEFLSDLEQPPPSSGLGRSPMKPRCSQWWPCV